jgi:hypothetical protein
MSRRKDRARRLAQGRNLAAARSKPVVLRTDGDPASRNPACYANYLGGCSNILSDEHFISYDMLMKLCRDPRGLFTRGAGRTSVGRWIQPETLAARVLCSNHNKALEPLDRFASDLADDLLRATDAADVSTVVQFFGPNLERWMMKALCGLVASGQAARNDGTPLGNFVPEWWVRCLFADSDLVSPHGLQGSGSD